MRRGVAAHRLGVEIAEMRQVHQIVDHQHVIGLDRIDVVLVGPPRAIVMIRKVDDPGHVGLGRITHPQPYQLVLLDRGVAPHPGVFRDQHLPGNPHAATRSVDDEAVIAALNPVSDHRAHMERRTPMTAAVGECSDAVRAVAKQHDRLVADAAGERLCADLIGPGGDVPGVTQQHRQPPPHFCRW